MNPAPKLFEPQKRKKVFPSQFLQDFRKNVAKVSFFCNSFWHPLLLEELLLAPSLLNKLRYISSVMGWVIWCKFDFSESSIFLNTRTKIDYSYVQSLENWSSRRSTEGMCSRYISCQIKKDLEHKISLLAKMGSSLMTLTLFLYKAKYH